MKVWNDLDDISKQYTDAEVVFVLPSEKACLRSGGIDRMMLPSIIIVRPVQAGTSMGLLLENFRVLS